MCLPCWKTLHMKAPHLSSACSICQKELPKAYTGSVCQRCSVRCENAETDAQKVGGIHASGLALSLIGSVLVMVYFMMFSWFSFVIISAITLL